MFTLLLVRHGVECYTMCRSILTLPLPFRSGTVNCYLLRTAAGCVLIDAGGSNARAALRTELERHDCAASALNLVLLTHCDFDHIGTTAHLRAYTCAPRSLPSNPALTGVASWNSSPRARNHDHRRLHGVRGGQMRQPCLTVTD
jgi:glyoxylase-like metal-dependent hydrolase (beta-lactamase superfamily II)